MNEDLVWHVDEVVQFRDRVWLRGWVHHPRHPVTAVWVCAADTEPALASFGLPSPDVAEQHGEQAASSRFEFVGVLPEGRYVDELHLAVEAGPVTHQLENLAYRRMGNDPYHQLEAGFWERLARLRSGRVLEIGSRARSGNTRRERLHGGLEYVGLDIVDGPNVDVVGDSHALASLFPAGHFDAVFAVSVFEHLLMPWKVAIEINRVLKPGGLVMVGTHQSWPLHDVPWDFWRYSDHTWRGLFNSASGFRILDVAMGEPAAVVAVASHAITRNLESQPAYLVSGVVAEKTSDTSLAWDLDVAEIVQDPYPH